MQMSQPDYEFELVRTWFIVNIYMTYISDFVLLVSQQLKQQRDKLKQYQRRITLQLEKERLLAKQLLKDGRKE